MLQTPFCKRPHKQNILNTLHFLTSYLLPKKQLFCDICNKIKSI
ncbi:hypothetical protein HMPREF9073_02202 [Capnocytophaga sp. oral taxon 326 str. F0382]|nr:hypothetical protein HMPREF9073_02202 [Capnocytophaga sp. oral taxon 326 str. F0382]